MSNKLVIFIILGVLLSPSSAFTLRAGARHRDSSAIEKHSAVTSREGSRSLSMTPRVSKLKSREGSPMMIKQTRNKKLYSAPGYIKGKFDLIRTVFRSHSANGQMTYNAFLDSKYLRFWPGRKVDIENIWINLTSNVESPLNIEQLPSLLSKLDEVAEKTELEMEQERLAWELEEIKHDFLEKYFESTARGKELSFSDFIAWESVQVQIWYNKRGLSERIVAEIWEKIAGCVTRGVDKDKFVTIYKTVCRGF